MSRQLVLPDLELPATLVLDPEQRLSDDEYFEFCMANLDLRLERTALGEIVIRPGAGMECSYRSGAVTGQLTSWAKHDGRGTALGCSAEFILADGATLSPSAAWIADSAIAKLTREQRRKFPPLCPEFIVEVMSPSDRRPVNPFSPERRFSPTRERIWKSP